MWRRWRSSDRWMHVLDAAGKRDVGVRPGCAIPGASHWTDIRKRIEESRVFRCHLVAAVVPRSRSPRFRLHGIVHDPVIARLLGMAWQPYACGSLQQAAPIRHSSAADLRRAGPDVADIQARYGHTRPEAAMIYRPLELARRLASVERLRRDAAAGGPESAGKPFRLARAAGRALRCAPK